MKVRRGLCWKGSGSIYGMFVVNSVSETHTDIFPNGSARKIEFTLTLTRVDESLAAMFGDMKAQADGLLNQAGGLTGQLGGLL
jgi:uncharacterized protein